MLEVGTFERLKEHIYKAEQLTELRSIRDQFQQSLQHYEQLYHKDSVERWNSFINELHNAFIGKTIELTEIRMVGEGLGPPPASYCYLLMGSAGRNEQTLASDQDSAIVFHCTEHEEQVKQYFKTFASYIVESLIKLGYPPCDGKVQSNEDLWCQSVGEWNTKLDSWFEAASWESIRYLLIVADARAIAGDVRLFDQIHDHYKAGLKARPHILERMIDNTVSHKMITGLFGQFITDRYGDSAGSIDIKYGAYIPFVNSVRWLALSIGIDETSTVSRLQGLMEQHILTPAQYSAYREAFLQMLSLRLMAGYKLENELYVTSSKLNPKRLEASEIKRLKRNLKLGRKLQRLVLKRFARL